MSIKESALSAITTITQSDFIRAVTSAGASRRVTVANLAKAIIESYSGSTMAGSQQSVKSAVDSVNDKIYTSIAQLGLSGTPTMQQVSDAMSNGSMCMLSTQNVSMAGMNYASSINTVVIFRASAIRMFAIGARAYNGSTLANTELYMAGWNTTSWVGWRKITLVDA